MAELYYPENVFGLTGGMGSGKSTVSEQLSAKGAHILDADQIVRDMQQPGSPLLASMAHTLGEEIITDDGALDRRRAGQLMFSDPQKKQAIEALIVPRVWDTIDQSVRTANPEDILILDVPLLVESEHKERLMPRHLVVVDTPVETAVERLVKYRGFTEEEARDRIGQQVSREDRLKSAGFVIGNWGTKESLSSQIDYAWRWMHIRKQLGGAATKNFGML